MQDTLDRLKEDQRVVFPALARFCLGPKWNPNVEVEEREEDHGILNLGRDYDTDVAFMVQKKVVLPESVTMMDDFEMVLLDGFAGTGKTTTINRLVEYCNQYNPQIKFAMTAPTNKALRILKKSSECKVALEFCTIHSLLGLKESRNNYTGERTFVPDIYLNQQRIQKINVLIMDETSQMKKDIFKYLLPHLQNGLKIIFLGDDKQIPPVGEVQSVPFLVTMRRKHNIHRLTLTKIHRTAEDNPILGYAAAIRDQVDKAYVNYDLSGKDHGETGIQLLGTNLSVLEPIFQKYFCCDEFKADSDHMKVVCWRNSTANYFNRIIRKLVFSQNKPAKIMVGEKLIAEHSIFRWSGKGKWEISFTTNEELEVISLTHSTKSVGYFVRRIDGKFDREERTFNVYNARVTVPGSEAKDEDIIDIIHEDSDDAYREFIQKFADDALKTKDRDERKNLWKNHYDCQKPFADVGYNYCITAHKAQGSSYNYVLVHEWDIDASTDYTERNRIRYVAVTRARNKLFIVKQ